MGADGTVVSRFEIRVAVAADDGGVGAGGDPAQGAEPSYSAGVAGGVERDGLRRFIEAQVVRRVEVRLPSLGTPPRRCVATLDPRLHFDRGLSGVGEFDRPYAAGRN